MKTILVPTDFSRSAETALHFAINLARVQKARIILLHVIPTPVQATPLPYVSLPVENDLLYHEATEGLKALSGKIDYAGGINYELLTARGGAVDQITRIAENRHVDLIVMGISQKTGFERFVFGTTALGAIRNARCPVLAVPEDMRIAKPIHKITFATDLVETDVDHIRTIADLARSFDAELCIMHISTEEFEPETDVRKFNEFVSKIADQLHYPKFTAEMLTGNEVDMRFLEYLISGNADLLAMSTRDRGLFARVFGKSLSKQAVNTAELPVVVFHQPELTRDKSHAETNKKARA